MPMFLRSSNPNPNPLLNANTVNLLALGHLGRLPVRSAHLQALVVPALGTALVQCLLLFTVWGRTLFPAASSGFNGLDDGGVIPIQRVSFQVSLVSLI